ncbi:MAG: transketolase family protein [Patescibacteria group bacterium]|nr:transketolase family protein [Patescibacteria group bacterium]
MLNPEAKLVPDIFAKEVAKKSTRDGFGTGSVEAGRADPRVVVLCADLAESTRAEWFQKEFPDRFIELGVAEQNLATVGSGMAAAGKIPFVASYAAFSPGRNYEQIRTTIALNRQPVKVCGMHAGIQTGPDGATHQMLEDIALMRVLPNMTVIVPADAEEARKATVAAAKFDGPVYLRFGRSNVPVFTTPETPFSIGKALTLYESANPELVLVATGSVAYETLVAAHELEKDGIGSIVINLPTVKPLDEEALVAAAKRAGRVVTVEEHEVMGGAGSAVAEALARLHPVPMRFLGLHDVFGQSGECDELFDLYGLSPKKIAASAREFVRGS